MLIRSHIAAELECPVWLVHQLSGKANEKGPGAFYDYTDSAESKSFAENLDFCFVIGKPNAENLCQLTCPKHRRTGNFPTQVVRIDGERSCLLWTKGKYVIDPHTRSICSAADAAMVVKPPKPQRFKLPVASKGDSAKLCAFDSDGSI